MSKKTDGFSKDNTIDINSLRLELVTGEIIDLLNMFQRIQHLCQYARNGHNG